jgi:hypothetical protein
VKEKQPPKWATLLLKRFGSSPNNDAIIGDLAEHFRRGRTARWYWKEALLAIVVAAYNGTNVSALRAAAFGWGALSTLCIALFPIFGRCTVLVGIAGFGSGLVVRYLSRRWLHLLVFIVTVHLYWIGSSVASSPYSPLVWLYQLIGFGLVRGALVSVQLSIGNLVVLSLAIWVGAVCGYSPSIVFNESGSLYE